MRPKLGIIAGGGDLPRLLVKACQSEGREYFLVALKGQAPQSLVKGHPHVWVGLAEAGKVLKHLRQNDVREVVMAGRVARPALSELRPDARGARFLGKAALRIAGDDGLLSLVVKELEEREGLKVVAPQNVVSGLLAGSGAMGRHAPNKEAWKDIRRGFDVAKTVGRKDVGQGVVVQQGLIIAVEAIEGTDAMLRRAKSLLRGGPGPILVKVKKPGQNRRVDLPTIGPATVRKALGAGFQGIAVEANGALIVDREKVITLADKAGVFVVGVTRRDLKE